MHTGYWHLEVLWFALIGILWIGYFVLEGFDFGVGTLLPFVARDDVDRRVVINAIGPVWDGNEVWLLTAGGATFAAFPIWYASLFSGFYLALFLILVALIVRGVAFEYRSKHASPRWRAAWDRAIFVGSALPALLWGVGFANIVHGVPIDAHGEFTGTLLTLLNPYALLAGVASLAIFTLHGALYLALKTDGEVRERARRASRRLSMIAAGLLLAFLTCTYVNAVSDDERGIVPGVVPLTALALGLGVPFLVRAGRDGLAFASTALSIALVTATMFLNLYPRVLVSSTDPSFSLTIWSSSSSHYTLGVMTVGASTTFAYNGHFVFLPSWFERRRGLAIGIVSAGAGAISIVVVPQVQQLIDRGGWRTGCIMMAIALVAIALPLNAALQRRRPEELGLMADGGAARTASGTRTVVHIVDEAWAATDWTLGSAMRTARFWYFSIGFFLGLFAWYAILVHQTKYLLDLGFNSTFAAWALGLVPMAGVGGQLLLGYLSDRIGREWVWTVACLGFFVCYACMFVLARHAEPWLVWVMVFTQGFLGYGMTPAIGAIPADLFQGRQYGRIFGVAAIFGSGGAALGPWVFGLLYDRTGSYDGYLTVAAIALGLAALAHFRLASQPRFDA